jgi:hypothetical protein
MLVQELPQLAVGYESLHKETEQQMAELREKEGALVSTSSSGSRSSSLTERSVQPYRPMLHSHLPICFPTVSALMRVLYCTNSLFVC